MSSAVDTSSDLQPVKKGPGIAIMIAISGALIFLLVFLYLLKMERDAVIQQFSAEKVAQQSQFEQALFNLRLSSSEDTVVPLSNQLSSSGVVLSGSQHKVWGTVGPEEIEGLVAAKTSQPTLSSVAGNHYLMLPYGQDSGVVAFPVSTLLQDNFSDKADTLSELRLLSAEGVILFSRGVEPVAADAVVVNSFSLLHGYKLSFAATEEYIGEHIGFIPAMFLLFGLMFSFLASAFVNRLSFQLRNLKQEKEVLSQQLLDSTWNDPLTNVANRVHFDEVLDVESRRAVREFSPLTLILVQLDHFDAYIEHYGRDAAEVTLQRVAELLSESVARPGDLVARVDTHVFGFILPSTNEQVVQLAERCCSVVREQAIPNDAAELSDLLTVSIGVSTMQPSKNLTPDRLLENASLQLEDAMAAGGDQYCAFAEDGFEPSATYSL